MNINFNTFGFMNKLLNKKEIFNPRKPLRARMPNNMERDKKKLKK